MKDIAWSELSFGYMPTDYNVRCCYRNGKWGEVEVCSDEYIKLHMAATCLHYGQEAFEGLKAYRCPDGKVRVFRMDENAARLQSTCRGHHDARAAYRNIRGDGEEGSAPQSGVHPDIRERRNALHPSAPHRYIGTGRRSSGRRVHVHHLRHTGRTLLQGWFLYKPVRHHTRLRPFGSARHRYLQGGWQLCCIAQSQPSRS